MKLIHISDFHLVPAGETLLGLDPVARMDACLSDVEQFHPDASLVVVSGDLSETGGADTYEILKSRVQRSPLTIRLMLGNHDVRENFAAALPDQMAENGFAQRTGQDVADTPALLLRLLPRARF